MSKRRGSAWALFTVVLWATPACRERNRELVPKAVSTELAPLPSPSPVAPPSPSTAASEPSPPLDLACTTDSDCAITSMGEDCCDHCGNLAVSKRWLARMSGHCAGRSHDCPSIDCPYQPAKALCRKGQCAKTPLTGSEGM